MTDKGLKPGAKRYIRAVSFVTLFAIGYLALQILETPDDTPVTIVAESNYSSVPYPSQWSVTHTIDQDLHWWNWFRWTGAWPSTSEMPRRFVKGIDHVRLPLNK